MNLRLLLLTILVATGWSGCVGLQPAPKPGSAEANSVRNNSYSLLFQLLDDEKNVSKILIIKKESTALNQLIKSISAAAGAATGKLTQFAKEDSSINLKDLALPAGEVRTRASVSSATTKELVGSSGAKFELTLLLTQAEALNYGRHLALVAAAAEGNPDRARYLRELSGTLKDLHERVVAMIAHH